MPDEGDRIEKRESVKCREVSLVVSVVKVEVQRRASDQPSCRGEGQRKRKREKGTGLTDHRFHQGHRLPLPPPTFFSRDLSLSTTSSGSTTTIPTGRGRGLATAGVRSSFALSCIGAEIVGREEGGAGGGGRAVGFLRSRSRKSSNRDRRSRGGKSRKERARWQAADGIREV
jgi:hypothetical protein